ncbi:MAG: aspartate aminotransferase family protein [Cytophagales bacterium]|nr:MAG: aspartate aminotransferase family protein [Cytophagales bacterium]
MLTHRQLFLQNIAQTSEFPLLIEIEKAKGMYFYTPEGKSYLDLIAGISVSNVGHCHPKVVEAVQKQAEKFMHVLVYGEFVQSPQTLLAKKIIDCLPAHLDNIYFVNSGTEAIEGAMKLAKRYTKKTEIISCFNAYHGATQGSLSIGGGENFKNNFRPLLPDTRQIHYGSFSDIEKITEKTACVIIEVVQGEAGVISACENYFKTLRKKCDETNTLLIFDEVQTGFGRTGTLFAFQKINVMPDILVLAKGMGGGMPIGAFVSNQKIMSVFKNNPILGHITTFGGHPVCCAAALASLAIIEDEKLYENAEEKGLLFVQLLQHQQIKQVRQNGLLLAVEFENFITLKKIIDKCLEKGLMTDWFLYCDNSMRIAPPLIINEEEIRWACKTILEAIDEVF